MLQEVKILSCNQRLDVSALTNILLRKQTQTDAFSPYNLCLHWSPTLKSNNPSVSHTGVHCFKPRHSSWTVHIVVLLLLFCHTTHSQIQYIYFLLFFYIKRKNCDITFIENIKKIKLTLLILIVFPPRV